MESKGLALPELFNKQWETLLGKLAKDSEALIAAQVKKQSPECQAPVSAAIDALKANVAALAKKGVSLPAFQEKQVGQLKKLVAAYNKLVDQRIKSNDPSEAAVLALRSKKEALLLSWEKELVALASKSRALVLSTFADAVKAAKPEARKALATVAGVLLQQEVHAQIEVISLVTGHQSADVSRFVVQAGGLVLHLAAAAQTAKLA